MPTCSCYHVKWYVFCATICALTLYSGLWQAVDDSPFEGRHPLQEGSLAFGARAFANRTDTDAYTLLIATFKRDGCLQLAITHYLSCNVQEIRVKWQDFSRKIPEWLQKASLESSNRLVIDIADADYLSSRFKTHDIHGEAVFTVDDDVRYPCEYLREAFRIWQMKPRQVVGFAPRRVLEGGCYRQWYSYDHIYFPFANAIWVTKGAFFHPDYLKEYWSPKYDQLRNAVDGNVTGEDMLMAFVIALSNPPGQRWPIVLYTRHSPDDKTCSTRALWKQGGRRCTLVKYFQDVLGFPLEYTPWPEFQLFEEDVGTFVPFSQSGHWAMPWYPLRMYWRFHHPPIFANI